MKNKKNCIKIGTRGSNLALAQTDLVIGEMKKHYPELEFKVVIIKTIGDKILDKPLLEFGGKGVFVAEFEEALLRNEIDLAVHSAKDMPMQISEGLDIIGVLKREDPRDVLITMKSTIVEEKESIVIGTSSLRRKIQIEELYSNIKCISIRGNVNTRLKKLSEGMYDGIILAVAGIKRLKMDKESEYNYKYLDFDMMVPSGGQGIIAIEGRSDSELSRLLRNISDPKAMMELEIERRALEIFGAGCHEPIGVLSIVSQNEVIIRMFKEVKGKILKKTGKTTVEKRLELVESMTQSILEEN